MRIVIVGGGVVGYSLAQQLLYEKHSISMIEPDSKVADGIAEKLDLQVIVASGSSPSALEDAGIEGADMVIAVTPVDEINLVVCSIARQYEVPQRIARLRGREFLSPDRHVSLEAIGVTSFIFPEKVMVDSILQYVETPGASDAVNFEDGNILLRGYRITKGMPMVGKSLVDIRAMFESEMFLVAAVMRGDKGIIPPGDFVIEEGDKVYGLFPKTAVPAFMSLVNGEHAQARRVVIAGDNLSSMELAASIQDRISKVIYVDPDLARAEEVAVKLDKVEVIHGDCTELDTLKEIDINRVDFFIASSNEADYNMLSALLAKSEGAREVIAVSTEFHHDQLFHSIGIDHVINPRVTAADEIMQIISRGHFGSVVRLGDAEIEALRLTVPEKSDITDLPLKKVWKKLRKGALIGIINRGDTMIIPDGESIFEPDDIVIIIAYTKFIPQIQKLFKAKK
ncbi:MAG: Trk system potassium transporter TrkA [FCB group bacterium]|nr:Trk system potassium transporter TrkA [FCB group bacterium]